MKLTTLELFKEDMKFSAGHFTILAPDRRERLHGHNFSVHVALTNTVAEDGLVVDYGLYKRKVAEFCREWNEVFLLPGKSPYLQIRETATHVTARFAGEDIPFLKGDVLVLPVANVTVEELAEAFLEKILRFREQDVRQEIVGVTVKVFSGPGQSASAEWILPSGPGPRGRP
jgi:6-pyruvoyltetrahydropterin/6-carboxytetrahydropterin synthase